MTSHEAGAAPPGSPGTAALIEAIPLALIDTPLDYILADHFRQRTVCVALKRFAAEGTVVRSEADMVIAFLDHDLPLHHEDEDEDLFPAVRRRALPEDDLGSVLARLSEDHRLSDVMVHAIVDVLGSGPDNDRVTLDRPARDIMLAYANSEHRHLAMENGIVMAIARIRLKPSDLKAISEAMKRRRGVDA
ncbi:MAG: hemerythrin domain-containing protein [Beijerinckiaceae bacterium]|jgi:hemerythrin-like domain-containing protein|nr:hemerythrin domain-containing protein [Beijerinckiaceae bacterium]